MKIIKEYCRATSHKCVVRTNYYGSGLDFFLKLFEEAKKETRKD